MNEKPVIRNPILPGFNPDPSIIRVGDDFFIATSTFEWFPGVQIHHSRDLVHWRLLTRVLSHASLLDLRGCFDSGGVFAPCLSYCDGVFYLVYTVARTLDQQVFDGKNYLTTARDIEGPWSEPVYLNASGFDPSLFHDTDGRKWLLNMLWDPRKGYEDIRNVFGGIVLQEYSHEKRALIGAEKCIFAGTGLGCTEGPHLYQHGGYYYLMTAEGGTGYEHAVTMARARKIEGPYEVDPSNPILTAAHVPAAHLQKCGHGSLVQTQAGEWYMAHLCSRPVDQHRRCILGRETAIQRCVWDSEGWLRLAHGGNEAAIEVEADPMPPCVFPRPQQRDNFDGESLNPHLNSLRVPVDSSWLSLRERPGHLRLYGRESLHSTHCQSLVARRLQAFRAKVATCVDFTPQNIHQRAGLVAYYNTRNYFYLYIARGSGAAKILGILSRDKGVCKDVLDAPIELDAQAPCHLAMTVDRSRMQFRFSQDGKKWQDAGPPLDAGRLSDDYVGTEQFAFTGAFVGLCAQDLSGQNLYADFDYFEYVEQD